MGELKAMFNQIGIEISDENMGKMFDGKTKIKGEMNIKEFQKLMREEDT